MKTKSLEAKVIDARAQVAALQGDERADYPSGPERTAYNKEFKAAFRLLTKWEAAFAAPEYLNGGVREKVVLRSCPQVTVPMGGQAYKPDLVPATWPRPSVKSRPTVAKRSTPSSRRRLVSFTRRRYERPVSGLGQDRGRKWTGNNETHQCQGCQQWHTARASYFVKQNGRTPGHCACGATSWLPKGSTQQAMVT